MVSGMLAVNARSRERGVGGEQWGKKGKGMVYALPHRSACTFSPRCFAPPTGAHHTPHRGAPQSTSLCELSWLHLSSLVRTTGENTATDQIESKKRLASASPRPSLYSFSKLTWSPFSKLLYGHPALVASLVSGQTSVHIPKHLPALLYHSGSSRYPCACFAYLCATVASLVHSSR
ncbi:signal peptide peptidase [Actinidia rufa]|uniref:Signal peptide peptidase n=1 Tax=Actinidia rufa TaxID=165716 RepID=A0A7J0HD42_9ERIC|nr:signal peptide peptidase [Actinidia rufa]